MRISVREQTGMDMCAGAVSGRELLSKLVAQSTREPDGPQLVTLDFSGVRVATGSFLRESVIAFRDIVRQRRSNYYPLPCNLVDVVREELEDMLQARGSVMLIGTIDDGERLARVELLGRLEPKQQRIFDLIGTRRKIDAGELQREFGGDDGVKQTSWNNRLSALALAGLVVELSQGRNKIYKPVFEDA